MDPASQFGRGTPAGKAIYRLYNKKSMDSTLDPELLARLQKMRKEREEEEKSQTAVKVVPKSRAHVPVPQMNVFKGPTSEELALMKLSQFGHKKRESEIKLEMKKEQPPSMPHPSKPPITEVDKDRLCQIMEYGEELRFASGHDTGATKRAGQKKQNERSVFEDRFDEVTVEISERKNFLAEMHKNGSALGGKTAIEKKATESRLLTEISDRVSEMKMLDLKLRNAD